MQLDWIDHVLLMSYLLILERCDPRYWLACHNKYIHSLQLVIRAVAYASTRHYLSTYQTLIKTNHSSYGIVMLYIHRRSDDSHTF